LTDSVLTIETFTEPSFGENAFVVSATDNDGKKVGFVIDPSFPPAVHKLLSYIATEHILLEKIVLTHGHADHVAGLDIVHTAHPDAAILMAKADQPMLADSYANLSAPFGMAITLQAQATDDLVPDMAFEMGPFTWKVLDTSGHSAGGRSLYCAQAGVVLTGDALFAGSIGRTDFPGSDHHQLIRHIRENLLSLPDATVVYSGHGPTTSVGNERKSNPFLSD